MNGDAVQGRFGQQRHRQSYGAVGGEMAKKDEHYELPTKDNSQRFSDDQRLRAAGFVIVRRPNGGPAIWRRGDKEYTFDGALRLLERESKKSKGD